MTISIASAVSVSLSLPRWLRASPELSSVLSGPTNQLRYPEKFKELNKKKDQKKEANKRKEADKNSTEEKIVPRFRSLQLSLVRGRDYSIIWDKKHTEKILSLNTLKGRVKVSSRSDDMAPQTHLQYVCLNGTSGASMLAPDAKLMYLIG